MAYFEETLEEIYKYLGPRTSDIVTQLARPHRKDEKGKRISCGEPLEDGTKCRQYTGLHAAHLKGRERKVLIQEILDEFGEKITVETYKIELNTLEREFLKKHDSFDDVIKFMCPRHHKQYDMKNGNDNSSEEPIIDLEEIKEIIEIAQSMEEENDFSELLSNKDFILKELRLLEKSDDIEENIQIFTNAEKCKELFKLSFPLLIPVNLINEELHRRYYSEEVFKDRKGNIYKITNHWYKEQRDLFRKWLEAQNK